ncbi:MAG TPA: DNA polymerase IV [Marmoricola sp.]|nr:DNA polymerase IV [Marmoricola sp.]
MTHLLHVDMDCFYASVLIRDRPELRDVPVVVGGGDRGVVLAANYPARRYGVRSALSMTRARRMCPDVVVLEPEYATFEAVSRSVMEIFDRVSPVVEAISHDEAFLDVSGLVGSRRGQWRSAREIAEHVRARVADEQRISCSVGVAGSVSVAKLASRRAKPDGVLVVPAGRVTGFLHPLDVGELWGVGEKTRDQLHRLGLVTVGDLAHTPVLTLQRALGPATAAALHQLAWGTDRRTLTPRRTGPRGDRVREKSMGADETFSRDTDDPVVVRRELLRMAAKVTRRMRAAGVAGRTVAIRVRFSDFTTITRSRTLADATDVTEEVYAAAVRLFEALGLQRARIRLVGVRVEGLRPREQAQRQMVLGQRERGWTEAERAVDRATSRFGHDAVRPATLLAGDRRFSTSA